ncbi:MAG: hemerythrin domain-containing protein [Pseudomonadota bacterium]
MTIFDVIREDHDKHRRLLELLTKTKGDSDGRRELFERLRRDLVAHAAAEEQTLYAAMMKDPVTVEKSRHSVAEHKELDDFLETLTDKDFSSSGWVQTAEKLRHRAEHHMEEEEREVFVSAGKLLDSDTKEALAEKFLAAKSEWLDSRS